VLLVWSELGGGRHPQGRHAPRSERVRSGANIVPVRERRGGRTRDLASAGSDIAAGSTAGTEDKSSTKLLTEWRAATGTQDMSCVAKSVPANDFSVTFYVTRFTPGGCHVPSPTGRIEGGVDFGQ
jgi:hypothetical protein